MAPADSKRELIDKMLGGRLQEYVTSRRNGGERLSWVRISGDLREEYGVHVTDEGLRKWFGDLDEPRDAKAAS